MNEADLVKAIPELASQSVLLFHAELDDGTGNGEHAHDSENVDRTLYSTFLRSRPPTLETSAIDLIISLHKRFPEFRSHIVHLSAAEALPSIKAARGADSSLTVETCFHYLCLTSDSIPNGRPEFKCCPPIRDATNQDKLWEALLDGTIDCVVSDHSPCIAELKRVDTDGDFMSAWGGIATLGLGLSLLWNEGKRRGVKPGVLVSWVTERTARIANLTAAKGAIRVGSDADFAVFDPEDEFSVSLLETLCDVRAYYRILQVTKEELNFKNKLTPYEGLHLKGRVHETWLRGYLGYDRKRTDSAFLPSRGRLI